MHNQIPGGWFTTTPDTNIDQYIRQNIKSLADAKLSKTESQVVAGYNYRYTYIKDNATWEVVVFAQDWTNTKEITYAKRVVPQSGSTGKTQVSIERVPTTSFTDVLRSKLR